MVELLRNGESFAVATIFDNIGSAPRTNGAKMIVRAGGQLPAASEAGVWKRMPYAWPLEVLSARQTVIQRFDLTSKDVAGMDMICGGTGEVLIDFVDAADENSRIVYEAAADIYERGEKAWLVTILDSAPGGSALKRQRCLVKPDKTLDRQDRL